MERHAERDDKRKEIRRRCEQQRDGRVVPERADDRGEEVVERLRRDEHHLQDDEHVQLRVEQRLLEAPPDGLGVLVADARVLPAQPVLGPELVLAPEEEVGLLEGEVWEDGDAEESDDDGHGAFDYEEPFLGGGR